MANRIFNPPNMRAPGATFSHGAEIAPGSRIVHTAGQVGVAPDGSLPDDFKGQAENTWRNLMSILADNGMGAADIVKVTHFLTRPEDIPAYLEVFSGHLIKPYPASTLLLVGGLARPEFLLEVEMIAAAS